MTFPAWWQADGWQSYELLWAIVSVVGLVLAVRWRHQHRKAFGWAVAGFAVMLLPGIDRLVLLGLSALANSGYQWAGAAREQLSKVMPVAFQTVGFVLLTVAIFVGRPQVKLSDQDAG